MVLSHEQLFNIRKLTVIALFSDDDLMGMLVLKGGNALEVGYGLNSRASIDIDVSLVEEFSVIGLENDEQIRLKLQNVLEKTFETNGYKVYDVKLISKPKKMNELTHSFWGGYEATFKLIDSEKYNEYADNFNKLVKHSLSVNGEKRTISIDFGRFEYCELTTTTEIDGYEIQIYTPELIIYEKLRAICQQMPSYLETIGKVHEFGGPRPRDFYDIHTILENDTIKQQNIDFKSHESFEHLKACFEAKKVPLTLLNEIKNTKDFHIQAEAKLKESIIDKRNYQGFDFYFNYIINFIDENILIPSI